jgi:hypothetical protein
MNERREHATLGGPQRDGGALARAEKLLGTVRCDCGRPVVEIRVARVASGTTVTGYCRTHQIQLPATTDAGRRLQLDIAEREIAVV